MSGCGVGGVIEMHWNMKSEMYNSKLIVMHLGFHGRHGDVQSWTTRDSHTQNTHCSDFCRVIRISCKACDTSSCRPNGSLAFFIFRCKASNFSSAC